MSKNYKLAALLLIINTFLFASNVLISKLAVGVIPPFSLAFFRWLTALLLFLPIRGKAFFTDLSRLKKEWKWFLIYGASSMLICGGLPFKAAHLTSMNNMALIYTFSAVVIIVLERVFYGVKVRPLQVVGVVLGTFGVSFVLFQGDLRNLFQTTFNTGDLLMVVAAVVWAGYSLLFKHNKSAYNTEERFLGNMFGGVLTLFPFFLMELNVDYEFTWSLIWFFLALGLFPSLLAFLIYQKVQEMMSSSFAGVVFYLVPIVNAVSAYFFLGETLEYYHVIGGGAALFGVYLANRRVGT